MFAFQIKLPAPPNRAPQRRKSNRPNNPESGFNLVLALISLVLAAHFFIVLIAMLIGRQVVPQVGDTLLFAAGKVSGPIHSIPARQVINSWAAPGRPCKLDIPFVTGRGGAATVLAVRQDGVMLSWAGAATAAGAGGCPAGASILVTQADYRRLLATQIPDRPTR